MFVNQTALRILGCPYYVACWLFFGLVPEHTRASYITVDMGLVGVRSLHAYFVPANMFSN